MAIFGGSEDPQAKAWRELQAKKEVEIEKANKRHRLLRDDDPKRAQVTDEFDHRHRIGAYSGAKCKGRGWGWIDVVGPLAVGLLGAFLNNWRKNG